MEVLVHALLNKQFTVVQHRLDETDEESELIDVITFTDPSLNWISATESTHSLMVRSAYVELFRYVSSSFGLGTPVSLVPPHSPTVVDDRVSADSATIIPNASVDTPSAYQPAVDTPPPPRHILVTGTPGTGKTQFALYTLYRLLTLPGPRQFSIVVDIIAGQELVVTPSGQISLVEDRVKRPPLELHDPKTWYLYDGRKDSQPMVAPECVILVTSSPNLNQFSDFWKLVPQVRYNPVWTLAELLLARKLAHTQFTSGIIIQRYNEAGGVPRSCFGDNDSTNRIKTAAIGLKKEDLLKFEGQDVFADKFGLIPHSVLHLETESPYDTASLTFCSNFARDLFLTQFENGIEVSHYYH